MAEQNGGLAPIKWIDVYNLFNTVGVADSIRRTAAFVELYGNGTKEETKAALRMRSDAARIGKAIKMASMSADEISLYNEKRAARRAAKTKGQSGQQKKHA